MFVPDLEGAIVDMLLAYNPCTIGKLLRLAFGFAVVDTRRQLLIGDITKACGVVKWTPKKPLGFL